METIQIAETKTRALYCFLNIYNCWNIFSIPILNKAYAKGWKLVALKKGLYLISKCVLLVF